MGTATDVTKAENIIPYLELNSKEWPLMDINNHRWRIDECLEKEYKLKTEIALCRKVPDDVHRLSSRPRGHI